MGLLLLLFILSLILGATTISFNSVITFWSNYNAQDMEHIVLQTSRVPRTVIAIMVGVNLSIAGVLIQALTRNAMASPGILGINASAMFFIVIFSTLFTFSSMQSYLWSSFLGAAFAGFLVWILGTVGSKQMSPIRMILAGSALTALFYSFTQAFLIINKEGLEDILFWLAGSVSNRDLAVLFWIVPYCIPALLLSWFLSRHINILAIGDEAAKGLGQNISLIRFLMAICIVILAGSSVSIAGSIGFVGLLVPHIAKKLFGHDNRLLIPASALLGANLLLMADIIARIVIIPREIPIGVMTALIGAPFFIYLIVKRKKHD